MWWLCSEQVCEFEKLNELMLLEECKCSVPFEVMNYLAENEVRSVDKAGLLEGQYALTNLVWRDLRIILTARENSII